MSVPPPSRPLRPDVAAFVERMNGSGRPQLHSMDVDTARRAARLLAREADLPYDPTPVDEVYHAPAPDGAQIPVRLFDTAISRPAGPVVVYFHGGGWTLGDVDIYASPCAEIARALDLPLLSVEYRRAPKHKSPIGPRDCEAAARWIATGPEELPVKPTSLILIGDSCGGAYAISTAIALRDAPAAVPVAAQLVFYPSADIARRYDSFRDFATGYLLDKHIMRWFAEQFEPDDQDFRASPMAADLTGLPPAMVVTAECDPLRDQGRAYAEALSTAGVPTVHHEAEGMVHAFLSMRRAIPSARQELAQCLADFRRFLDALPKAG